MPIESTYSIFRHIVESIPSAIVVVDKQGSICFLNSQTEKIFGYEREELLGQKVEILIPGRFSSNHPKLRETFSKSPGVRAMGADRELYALRKDGTEFPVEIGLNPMTEGEKDFILASIIDITERKAAGEKLMHANRLYSFLSHINQAILHDRDREILFNHTCRIAIEIGKFSMVWIGMADSISKTVNLVAQQGLFEEDADLFIGFPYETGVVLKHVLDTGEPYICNNIEQDFPAGSWKIILLSRNCHSFIVLPIKREDNTVGVFGLASPIVNFFNPEETALLTEAAEDISFAKTVFEKDRKKAEAEREKERVLNDLVARNRDLEHFAHILSHNVRAPLSTLLGLIELVTDEITPEDQAIILQGVSTNALQLDKVIKDLNEILNI